MLAMRSVSVVGMERVALPFDCSKMLISKKSLTIIEPKLLEREEEPTKCRKIGFPKRTISTPQHHFVEKRNWILNQETNQRNKTVRKKS